MSLIFGIGTGLFSLGILWIVGLLLCLLLARLGKHAAVFGLVLVLVVLSLVMALYPREDRHTKPIIVDPDSVDQSYITRVVYACFVSLFVLVALVAYFIDHVLMPNIAHGARSKKAYTF